MKNKYKVRGKVWLYSGMAGWHFVTLPKKQSKDIKLFFGEVSRGWGSLQVVANMGSTSWKTSIFPEKKSNAFLPIKDDVRNKENIEAGDTVNLSIEMLV